mgnify:CR=1 FL=1
MSLLERVKDPKLQLWQQNIYKVLDKFLTTGYNIRTKEAFLKMQENVVEAKGNADVINPQLTENLEKDSPMKEWLVDYVGNKANPDNDEVNLAMIIETMAEEFPEFLLALAEENWIRGYHQAINDMETGKKLYEEELKRQEENGS